MWQKVRSIWAFIYDHYYNDFDWFHLGGDDVWMIMENFRAYLESDEIRAAANGGRLPKNVEETRSSQIPLYIGQPLLSDYQGGLLYNTGGPGYTLNKAALKLLATKCLPFHRGKDVNSVEDWFVGECLRSFNVTPYWTMDENGGNRFHHYMPGQHYSNTEDRMFKKFAQTLNYHWGKNFSSPYSISFHYINKYVPTQVRRLHALTYGPCQPSLLDLSKEDEKDENVAHESWFNSLRQIDSQII